MSDCLRQQRIHFVRQYFGALALAWLALTAFPFRFCALLVQFFQPFVTFAHGAPTIAVGFFLTGCGPIDNFSGRFKGGSHDRFGRADASTK